MLNSDVHPSTLEGVKRLAKQIKKQQGIKHSEALDVAAHKASCANYRHAQRMLPESRSSLSEFILFLTIYWHDKRSSYCGRETLKIKLSKSIFDLCSKSDLKLVRGFGTMRMVAPDHFLSDNLANSQDYARNVICKAERSLRFMEHTGLRPSRDYRAAWPDRLERSKLPGSDHPTTWVDPMSGQFILIDEPYSRSPNALDRLAWVQQHGWLLRKSSWPGMYYPYRCDLYVATRINKEYDFDALVAKIDSIPPPLIDESWDGESGSFFDIFVSPLAKTPQDHRRARSKATIMPKPSRTTIPYTSIFGNSDRRPAGAMPVASHIEVGRIIKSVIHSLHSPYGVERRMNSLRARLEEWLALEIGRSQLDGPEFFNVYYGNADSDVSYAEAASSRIGLIRILNELKVTLQTAYPNCAPLRKQLRRIDMSIIILLRMKAIID